MKRQTAETHARLLRAIVGYMNANKDISPTLRELSAETGKSLTSVRYNLRQMRERNIIYFLDGKPRTIKPLID